MLASLFRIRHLLERKDAVLLGILLIMILVMAALEVLGIASILPFMRLAAEPGVADETPWSVWVRTTFDLQSREAFLIAVGTAVFILLTVANAFAALTTWLQHQLAWSIAHRLSVRLVKTYASLPYEFYLTHNSADLIKKLISEVNNLVTGVLLAGSEFTARVIVSAVIFALLIVVQPRLGVLAFGVFVGVYGLIYFARYAYVTRLGQLRLDVNYVRYKTFVEIFSGIKTVKTQGAEDYFIRRFESASQQFSRIHPRFQFVSTAPRYFVETLAFGGIIAIILYQLSDDGRLTGVLPTLSFFALAGYRLLPSLHKAFAAATQLRHNFPAIDDIYNDIRHQVWQPDLSNATVEDPIEFKDRISLRGISFAYESCDAMVLKDICLTIPRGARVAFVGATGSGKTTLVDIIMGLLPVHEGPLFVDDTLITPNNVSRWHRAIGYVPQEVFLYDDTIARNVAFGVQDDEVDVPRIREVCRVAYIDEFIEHELPQGYQTEVGERGVRLSGGQRQRLGLARALYRKPRVLILDEATSALDTITEKAVMRSLHERFPNLTLIVVAHRLSTVRSCEQIYLLEGGRIIEHGSFEELFATNSRFREMVTLAS